MNQDIARNLVNFSDDDDNPKQDEHVVVRYKHSIFRLRLLGLIMKLTFDCF